MISITGLCKSYHESTVLQDIDLTIPDQCIFGIVGQSGAGKSTLLRSINGLEHYDKGAVAVNGTDVGSLSGQSLLEFRRKIGMIFQNFSLLERKSVLENVCLPMECWKYSKQERHARAIFLLKRVGLSDKIHAMPSELSGGQKQRVAIARALTMNPSVLLCDEATSALDPSITQSILELLIGIRKEFGITILIVTHEMSVVKAACDQVAVLEEGKIVAQGTVEDIFLQDSRALSNLIGRPQMTAVPGHAIVRIPVLGEASQRFLFYEIGARCNIPYTIVCANMEQFQGKYKGNVYLSVADKHLMELMDFLKASRIAAVLEAGV